MFNTKKIKITYKSVTKDYADQTLIDLVASAITNKKMIELVYDGHPRLKVEPFILGFTTTGKCMLHCYQNLGTSVKGTVPAWKNFELKKMRSIRILDEIFIYPTRDGRPDYNPYYQMYPEVVCKV